MRLRCGGCRESRCARMGWLFQTGIMMGATSAGVNLILSRFAPPTGESGFSFSFRPASSHLHAHILRLREEPNRFITAFAADAALSHAAERHPQVAQQPAVDPDGAALDLFGDAVGAGEVVGPDGGGEAVAAVVGEVDGVGFVAEGHDGDDGAEDLFLVS